MPQNENFKMHSILRQKKKKIGEVNTKKLIRETEYEFVISGQ